MNAPTLTYNTTDGRTFDDHEQAKAHQALLNKIDRYMDAENVPDGARNKTRRRIVGFLDFDAVTKGDDEQVAA